MADELWTAQRYGIADSASFPSVENDNRFGLVDTWREAVAKQLLTPAPTLADVAWKRAKVKSDDFKQLPITLARAEQAIADDLAFLAAHPTRRSNSEAMARSREFKEAMRRRIRELAASRNLPDEEIKSDVRLKHQEIGAFAVKHSVSLAWLLEGAGPIFKKYSQEHDQRSAGADRSGSATGGGSQGMQGGSRNDNSPPVMPAGIFAVHQFTSLSVPHLEQNFDPFVCSIRSGR